MTDALRTTSTETLSVAEAALGSSVRQALAHDELAHDDVAPLLERISALEAIRGELADRAARWDLLLKAAERAGTAAGTAAASWVTDGNTTRETYARLLRGIDDGDSEVLDSLPFLDLSGEWADGVTVADVVGEVESEARDSVTSIVLGVDCEYDLSEPDEESAGIEACRTELVDRYQATYAAAVVDEVERVCRHHLSAAE